jgi:hypothetical protein
MNSSYVDLLKETFEDMENISLEKIQKLSQETANYFSEIQGKLSDPIGKKEAEVEAAEIQDFLDAQMEKLSQMTGMNLSQLIAMAENGLVGGKEINVIQDLKNTIKTN